MLQKDVVIRLYAAQPSDRIYRANLAINRKTRIM